MNIPFFSIIIPIYNVEKYIKECIQSCLDQTFQDFEIVIIDDCGSDNSTAIVKEFKDIRIKFFHNMENMGTLQSRLLGLHKAKGKFVLFLDGDDMLFPNILHNIHQILGQHNHIDVLSFRCKTNKAIKTIKKSPIGCHKTINLDNYFLWGKCFNSSVIKKGIRQITTQAKILNGEDVYLNLIFLSLCHKYIGIKDIGYFYRIHNKSITHTSNPNKMQDLQELIKIINQEKSNNLRLKKQALKILKSAYWIEQRYEKNYLLCCVRAFNQLPRAKTFLRLLIYIFSLGKIKI